MKRLEEKLGLKVARLNPYAVSHSGKASMRRNITDKISAYTIAEYLINNKEMVNYGDDENGVKGLRKKWRFVNMLNKQRVDLRNEMESILYTNNPEILTHCENGMPRWVMLVLKRWPTAERLAKARISALTRIPYVTESRARELKERAKKSVASSSEDGEIISSIIALMLKLTEMADKGMEEVKNKKGFKEFEKDIERLKTIPGIDDYSATGLMLEIIAVERFKDVKKLASYAGIHPVYKMSGDGKYGFKMSKRGRKEIRRLLFTAAMNGIKFNPILKSFYEKKLGEGMNRMAAIGVCMHKLLRIVYGMLKNEDEFDPKVDERNRKRDTRVATNVFISYKGDRRYQEYSKNAPISGRQAKRRKRMKERAMSQDTFVSNAGSQTHSQKKL